MFLGYHVRLLFPPQPSRSCTNVSFNHPRVFDHPRIGAVAQKCAWITCPHRFYSFPFMLLPNKITYYSLIYFKKSKQGYLISFNSFPFHFFSLLKYIQFLYDHSIAFNSIPFWTHDEAYLLAHEFWKYSILCNLSFLANGWAYTKASLALQATPSQIF